MQHIAYTKLLSALIFGFVLGCSGGGGGSGEGGAGATGQGGSGASGAGGAGSGASGSGTSASGGGSGVGGPFRYGVNFGHPNPNWGDPDDAFISHEAGANGARLKLPEGHLVTWGYEIEVNDMKAYEGLGMHSHVAFLGAPTADHSTAPAGTPSWQLEYYIPKNLYEPVFLADGSINPNNYWGAYVFKTVSTYKPWVGVWEVWNEPDWVPDWQVTQKWDKEPPTKDELVRFGGSIFDYVRMLRVSFEAAKKADPEARIALGGIGYPNFLSAVLRYTDNPAGGSVSAEFPKTGADYFDVVSYHYYPVFGPGSSDEGVDGFVKLRGDLLAKLAGAGVSGKSFTVTETGAPHVAVGGAPGGDEYAPNYLVKVMTAARAAGVEGVDWFAMSDGAPLGSSTNSFDYMGLYLDVSKLGQTSEAVRTQTGKAYRTLGQLLGDARHDEAGTTALVLPAGVSGEALRLPDMRRAYVLWARTSNSSESASAMYSLATDKPVRSYPLDFGETGASELLTPQGGSVVLALSGTPRIYIEE